MDISEIGNSIQIRIKYEDGERIKKLKHVPEESWHKVITRILNDFESLKKQVKTLEKEKGGLV
jgi:hypothetical protein